MTPSAIAPAPLDRAAPFATLPLGAAVPDYLHHLANLRGASPHTITAYRRALGSFFASVSEPLTGEGIREWTKSLDAQNLGARTRALYLAAVRAYAKWHEREYETGAWTLVLARRAPRYPHWLPAWLRPEQITRLFAHLEHRTDGVGWRDRALVEFAYATGARLSSICGLNVEDLDFAYGDALLRTKGKRELRVPFGRPAAEALEVWLGFRARIPEAHPHAVFLGLSGRAYADRLTPRGLQLIFAKHTQAVFGRPIRFHALRHSTASHLLDRGAPLRAIQELLGHSNINHTAHYCHIATKGLHRAYANSHPTGERYEGPATAQPVQLPPERVLHKGDLSQRLLARAYQAAAMREVCDR